jgi:glycosyltransferase involved in cell wall biosynthesis
MSAVSDVAAEPLRRLVGPGAAVGVLPNGIDVARWAVGPLVREPGPLRLVTAMRLAARKRPAALVGLVAEAERRAGPGSVSLTVLGDGPDRRKVETLVRERGLDWVSLPGRVSRDELRERYAVADVYLSPARLESFGIAALEARTVGLPVIGRSGSGVGEFVTDGVNGLVVSSDSEMTDAIARLAADPEEVARLRRFNVEHPPDQEWSRVAALAVAEYQRAVGLVRR